jgi:hypothetical protein
MNIKSTIVSKKPSFWRFGVSMWIKPRATICYVVEAITPVKIFFLLGIMCSLMLLFFCFPIPPSLFFKNFKELNLKDLAAYLGLGGLFVYYGFIAAPLVALAIGGGSWLLKTLGGGRRLQVTLQEIFFTNVWIVSFWGIASSVILWIIELSFSEFSPSLRSQLDSGSLVDLFVPLWCLPVLIMIVWLLWISSICLSEIMKISKLRILSIILIMFFIAGGWISLFYLPLLFINQ